MPMMMTVRSALVALLCLSLFGCATRPLVLAPRVKPLDTSPTRQHDALVLMPFQDAVPEDDIGRKRFRDGPIDVFNDTLLVGLRTSQVFARVVRSTEAAGVGYRLSGVLRSLKTDESVLKFALASSTMGITATCLVSFRLDDARTGAILLEDTFTATGRGQARVYGGGQYTQYDSTSGDEESLSEAISEAAGAIVRLVADFMAR